MARVRLSDTDDWQLVHDEQDIRGWEVRDSDHNRLGQVEDMIIDTDSQQVETIVLGDNREIAAADVQIGENVVTVAPGAGGTVSYGRMQPREAAAGTTDSFSGDRPGLDKGDFGLSDRADATPGYMGDRPGLDAGDFGDAGRAAAGAVAAAGAAMGDALTPDSTRGRNVSGTDANFAPGSDVGMTPDDVGAGMGSVGRTVSGTDAGYMGDKPGLDAGDFGDAGRAAAGAATSAGDAVRDVLTPGAPIPDDDDFRSHYDSFYSGSGRDYAHYEPGYRYGHEMASDNRYAGRSYEAAESDLRGEYRGQAGDDSVWDDIKDAVRHGFNRARNAVDRAI